MGPGLRGKRSARGQGVCRRGLFVRGGARGDALCEGGPGSDAFGARAPGSEVRRGREEARGCRRGAQGGAGERRWRRGRQAVIVAALVVVVITKKVLRPRPLLPLRPRRQGRALRRLLPDGPAARRAPGGQVRQDAFGVGPRGRRPQNAPLPRRKGRARLSVADERVLRLRQV